MSFGEGFGAGIGAGIGYKLTEYAASIAGFVVIVVAVLLCGWCNSRESRPDNTNRNTTNSRVNSRPSPNAPAANAANTALRSTFAKVKRLEATLRSGPGATDEIESMVQSDRLLLVSPTACGSCHQRGWYRVKSLRSGKEGWVHGDDLELE